MRQATLPRLVTLTKNEEEEGKYKWSSKHMCINPPENERKDPLNRELHIFKNETEKKQCTTPKAITHLESAYRSYSSVDISK